MTQVMIGVGSNLNNPEKQVRSVCQLLKQLEFSTWVKQSSLYRSQPLGPQDQPEFINAAVMLDTQLSAHALLDVLQQLEDVQGRVRGGVHWGPRVVDLDLLLYGDEVITTDRLTIPHPGLTAREFVLYPLAEIVPDLILPSGESILTLQAACPARGLERLVDEGGV